MLCLITQLSALIRADMGRFVMVFVARSVCSAQHWSLLAIALPTLGALLLVLALLTSRLFRHRRHLNS